MKADSLELLRRQLSSINLDDIAELEKVKLNSADATNRSHDCEVFYNSHFKNVLELFIWKQIQFIANKAENFDQVMLGRGTVNGLFLIKEWFEKQERLSKSRFDEEAEESN